MYRIGVDIGGTFTDFALVGGHLSGLALHKQLTTPDDPSRAVLEGVSALLDRHGVAVTDVAGIVHGTTLVTNAVIERRGARTGLLVTEGFRDTLDIGLEQRYDLFDLRIRFAPPLVDRSCHAEVAERMRYDGTVMTPLDTDAACAAVGRLVAEQGIEALAICFLHSYANPAHEAQARAAVAAAFPDLYLSASSDVVPYIREFERWTTTVANAYTQPLFDRYLGRLEAGLAAIGFRGSFHLMSSSGGTVTPETARRFPVRMLESGPAAGVLMSAEHGRRRGLDAVLSFDLGGTTAKGALVRDGRPLKAYGMEVAATYHYREGSGLPMRLPVIDMTEIGSGGGSIAAVDERGLLEVGPRSAGAAPGPACYGLGGGNATLTDANLLLGILDPAYFLGGDMRLDPQAAARAVEAHVARPLGLDTIRAAWGIHDTVNEDIARAFRLHAVQRGFDCRRATMVAFGGGGPIHAAGVARKLHIPRVVLPIGAGVMSALGLLASPLTFEIARSLPTQLPALDVATFTATFATMEEQAASLLRQAGVGEIEIVRRVDMRYRGQGHEIEIDLPGDLAALHDRLPALFAEAYERVFGLAFFEAPLEIVTWKVEARGPAPAVPGGAVVGTGAAPAAAGSRRVYLPEAGAFAEVPVHDRYALAPGARVAGPALIRERESTCLLRPGDVATVDDARSLIVDIVAGDA